MKLLEHFTLRQSGKQAHNSLLLLEIFHDFRAVPVHSLADYIKNGFDLKLMVAIDYTVSPCMYI